MWISITQYLVRSIQRLLPLALVFLCWVWSGPARTACGEGIQDADPPPAPAWTSLGLSGGGAMYTPAVSPVDPNLILLGCDMGGAYRTTDGGKNWEMIHYRQLAGSTRVRPAWHPKEANVAFAASGWGGGSMKVTRDKGKTWASVPGAPANVTAIGIDPERPARMLAGGRGIIARSEDGGKTWTRSQAQAQALRGRVLEFHFDRTSPADHRVCFAATDQAVLRSDDAGATWNETPTRPGAGPIAGFTGGSNQSSQSCIFYCSVGTGAENATGGGGAEVGNEGGVYRSEDRGKTWTLITIPSTPSPRGRSSQPEFILTTDVDPSRVYVAGGRGGRVLRSDDRGANWHPILFPTLKEPEGNVGPSYLIDERGSSRDNVSGFGVNPADPDQIVVTDWMSCYITRNGGKTWDAAHTRSAEEAGKRGKGMRWINNGLVVTSVWHYHIDPFEPNRHYISYTDVGFARSTDAGKTWYWQTGRPLRNTTYELAFDPEIPGTIWGAFADLHDIPNNNVISGRHYFARAGGGVGVSTDFAATWKDTSRGLPGKPVVSVVVDPRSPKGQRTLYASVFEEGVYKSTDNGQTWTKTGDGVGKAGGSKRACRLILHRDGTLFCLVTALRKDGRFVAEGPGLYRSGDGGKSWSWINQSKPLLWPKDFDVDPRDSRVIYLGAADPGRDGEKEGGLYKTTDAGATWKRIARQSHDCFGATVDPRNPDRVYMCITEGGSEPGLWRSDDGGNTWRALEDLPFAHIQRVSFDPSDPSVIYVSTFGGSVWRGPAR